MELLAPAGSLASLIAAINAGADAVYMGGKKFGARAYAENPDDEGLLEALSYVHLHGRKLFLTVNTLQKEKELNEELLPYLEPLVLRGLDAVIVQDMGVLRVLHEAFPSLPLHASTQMTVCGPEGIRLLKEMGVSRFVLPRELTLNEIRRIYEETGAELELFVHGALCCSYSGQCLMSSFFGGRSGNRGRCAQPCRLPYEGGRLLNMKDLCALPLLPELQAAGAASLKIEGRMKSPEYTAGVVSIYRKYLDLLKSGRPYAAAKEDMTFLSRLFDRGGFTGGYFKQHNGPDMLVTGEKTDYVTASAQELAALRERYGEKRPLGLEGDAFFAPGEAARLTVKRGSITVQTEGSVVEKASSRPLSRADAEKQLLKTGDSPFFWEKLKIEIRGEGFLPVSALNRLRRDALAAFEEAYFKTFRRDPADFCNKLPEKSIAPASKHKAMPDVRISLDNPAQLPLVLPYDWVEGVYLSADYLPPEELSTCVKLAHQAGKKLYYAFPYLFREPMRRDFTEKREILAHSGADGFLLRSLDELGFVLEQELPGEKIADAGIYCWNNSAAEVLAEAGADLLTYPLEPHRKELEELSTALPREIIIYGRLPLMLSAQCPFKTTGRCLREEGSPAVKAPAFFPLRDRTGAELPTEGRCRYCYSVMLNAVPLWLIDQQLPPADFRRISVTTEGKEELLALLKHLDRGFSGEPEGLKPPQGLAFTRGHFTKGVQ